MKTDRIGRDGRRVKNPGLYRLDYIHEWMPVLESPKRNLQGEDVFRDVEKLLYRSGLHSKLVLKGDKYVLYVRKSEYEPAKDLIFGNVSAVYKTKNRDYVLFEEDLSYVNKKFYHSDNGSKQLMRRNQRRMAIFLIVAVILVVFAFFYARGF